MAESVSMRELQVYEMAESVSMRGLQGCCVMGVAGKWGVLMSVAWTLVKGR